MEKKSSITQLFALKWLLLVIAKKYLKSLKFFNFLRMCVFSKILVKKMLTITILSFYIQNEYQCKSILPFASCYYNDTSMSFFL